MAEGNWFDENKEKVILKKRNTVAIYVNENDELIITQEDVYDSDTGQQTVYLPKDDIPVLITKLNELYKTESM